MYYFYLLKNLKSFAEFLKMKNISFLSWIWCNIAQHSMSAKNWLSAVLLQVKELCKKLHMLKCIFIYDKTIPRTKKLYI